MVLVLVFFGFMEFYSILGIYSLYSNKVCAFDGSWKGLAEV